MDYKELLELVNGLSPECLKDLSQIVRKNQEAHPNKVTYEEAKAQIERFKQTKNG